MTLRSAVSVLALGMTLGLMAAPANAQLFGPSDEEKAREASQDQAISDALHRADAMDSRVQALEGKVRSLTDSLAGATGANEQLSHQLRLQDQKIDQMQKDFAYRICTLSAQQLGADAGSLNCAAGGAPDMGGSYGPPPQQGGLQPGAALPPIGANGGNPAPVQLAPDQTAYDATPGRGRPPGVLGSMPADRYGRPLSSSGPSYGGPTRLSSLPPAPPPPPAARGGSSQFDAAMNLLSKAQYTEAAAAFQSYADANPDDTELTPQAIYWVGNINYVQRNYEPAQRSFAEVLKKFPKSDRAPEAMLKLAQSFLALGQKSEGCTTLGLIKTKYPKAPDATLATAASLRRTSCR